MSISFCVQNFFGKPPQKDSEYPTYKYVFNLRTKNFRNKTLGGKYRIVGKCDIGQVFAISPIALVVAQLGNARKGALSL